ncbi:MAG TPA: YafY family protein [Acetobacteraceae bacterium]
MRRSDRLFDIIQRLRTARGPMTAAALADELEVTVRTVYRDVATLQARRVPIEGAPGIGYMLRRGFDLPPLMFTTEEIEAIAVGARLVARTGDPQDAAESVLPKVTVVLPEALRMQLASAPIFVSPSGAPAAVKIDLSVVRQTIRDERKLRIAYADEKGACTERTVWPIAVAYYVQATLIGAWCELRQDYRHFRADRIAALTVLDQCYPSDNGRLMAEWLALRQTERVGKE